MKKIYKADLKQLEAIAADAAAFCGEIGADPASAYALNLCLDEIFTNIVQYGYRCDASKEVEIELSKVPCGPSEPGKAAGIAAVVRDDAPEFNPLLQAPAPDTQSALENREIGGLGVFLIKKNMDKVEYARRNGKNELSMFRKLA